MAIWKAVLFHQYCNSLQNSISGTSRISFEGWVSWSTWAEGETKHIGILHKVNIFIFRLSAAESEYVSWYSVFWTAFFSHTHHDKIWWWYDLNGHVFSIWKLGITQHK